MSLPFSLLLNKEPEQLYPPNTDSFIQQKLRREALTKKKKKKLRREAHSVPLSLSSLLLRICFLSDTQNRSMGFLLAAAFVLLSIVEQATSFSREIKLSEFRFKLEQKLATPLSQSPSASPPSASKAKWVTKMVGECFIQLGMVQTQQGQKRAAMLKAVEEAFALQSGLELLPGVNDLGGVVIDLQGGNYKISKPITFPSSGGGNVVVTGGSLRAADIFPDDRHLVELRSPNDGIHYEDITFRDILFDSRYRGGGLFIFDSARIRINNCFFLHFSTEGILVQQGHETFISSCFLGQHSTVGGDKGEKDYSGTAIDLASNDNAITDVAIFSAAVGIVVRGQANIITGVHCYDKATGFGGIGILVKLAGNSQTRIDNCYLDYTGIVMEDPVQVHVTNGFFLGDANVVLKSVKGQILGLNIVDNMFSGNPSAKVPIVQLEGQFSNIDQVVIDRNNVVGMGLRSTVGKLTVAGNGTKWVADFSPVLVFPGRINYFQYSFYSQEEPKFVAHSVTNVSNNMVVVESEKAVRGVVSFVVEQ